MASAHSSYGPPDRLLALSAELNRARTVGTAVTRAIELVETVFDQPVASVCQYDPRNGTATTLGPSVPPSSSADSTPDRVPEWIVERHGERGDDQSGDGPPEATVDTDPWGPLQAEVLVPVGRDRVLRLGVTDPGGFDDTDVSTIEEIATNLETALARIDRRQSTAVDCDLARALFDQSDEATFVSDTDGGLVAVSQAALESTGRDREELLNSALADVYQGEAAEAVAGHLERVVSGAPEPLTTTFRRGDDADVTIELASHRVSVDGSTYIHTTARDPSTSPGAQSHSRRTGETAEGDATALRRLNELTVRAEEDVTERRKRSQWLGQFLNQGPLMFVETCQVDGEAVVETCNDRFLDRLGYDRAEVEGAPLASLYTADSTASLREEGYEAALADEFETNERTLLDTDGNRVHTLLRAVPRRDETTGTNALFVDISERKEHERRKDATVDVLERVYEVTTDPDLSFEQKVDGLLAAGSEYLDLPYAFLTQIQTGDDAPGTQTIVEARGTHELLQPGESCPLPKSYCKRTIQDPDLNTITNAARDGWAGDPAYETFGLETYIAGSVEASAGTYGTLCFASREPRAEAFTETEQSFVNLLRRWVGYELARRRTREELRQQRERLELTLSGTNTGIAEWDLETDAVNWNETLVELVNRDVDSIDGFEEAVHPDDRTRVRESLEAMVETGEPWVGEFRMVDCDGAVRWVMTRAVPTYDDEGNPKQVLATGTDITDRKREERERRRNERRYRTLAENIPNGAVLTFDADLEYDLAAGELLSAYGLDESDVSGAKVGTLFPDEAHDLVPRFRAALDGVRTDRRVELRDRTLRIHIVPVDASDVESADAYGLVLAQDVTDNARRERELFEERERFRLLTESVDEYAFLVVDEDGAIETWNKSAETTFGYDAETAVGMSMAELHPETDRESGLPERLLQQARVAGESAHEGRRVRADGSEFYADVRHAPLEADDGTFRGYAAVVRDMTDRRRQQRRTERFVAESEDVVTVVDADGTITYASGSANRVLGYDPDDLVGENLFDYLHPAGREAAMETFFRGLEDPDANFQAECRLESGDGEWLNIEGQCRNMLDDDAIGGMLLYLRDVTERKRNARRFESIFNQTFQFTGLLEPDGTVVEINDAALEFGGIDLDTIVGEPFSDARWWTHSEAVGDEVRNALERAADGEFVRYETEVRGGGGLATIDFSVKPVTDEDGDVSLLVVEGRDITARQQQRRHLEVMQRVMRHNMRNDLTKMRGWTQVMCEETSAEKRAEQFETIERILDKWEAMTEKMKEIRQVLQSQKGQWDRTDAGALVENAVAPIRKERADATIVTDVTDVESTRMPTTLSDAVGELVENAIDAREDATIEVTLARPEDGWIEVGVRDNGPGMPDMEADVLETGEESPLNHGQGLGLWMVRMIVTRAGGEVSVESTADGTEVCLLLPTGRIVETEGAVGTAR